MSQLAGMNVGWNARLVLELNAFAPLSFALVLGCSTVRHSMHGDDGNSLATQIS